MPVIMRRANDNLVFYMIVALVWLIFIFQTGVPFAARKEDAFVAMKPTVRDILVLLNATCPALNALKSLSGLHGQYMPVDFAGTFNPSIVPHPSKDKRFIITSRYISNATFMGLKTCEAKFEFHALVCEPESIRDVVVEQTSSKHCTDKATSSLAELQGQSDPRVFYGPKGLYITYGLHSKYACFGQAIQDFNTVFTLDHGVADPQTFTKQTEIQRPDAYHKMEKNFFLFFPQIQANSKQPLVTYVQHDLQPKRVFSDLKTDGSVGGNIGLLSKDEPCLRALLPSLDSSQDESIHQSTNTLALTLCNRGTCTPDNDNTLLITIFHKKNFKYFHAEYEPYLMAFSPNAPFGIVGISSKPFWIEGRGVAKRPAGYKGPYGRTEMLYVVSMSWRSPKQTYQGFLDDPVLLSLGIQDESCAATDVYGRDLLGCLATCP
ncbi:hypothetical protein BCR37DRAFT_108432 [Protomyces lactucae-debilis]|uniref:Uncharacterized protein n=1 Tax=Protomyces lactucae-debilis TaxID=2754530 RepID=A0A1Y2F3Z2_PROLT|nr:uncharacterized protein BCR37DRAFT_108432 [Protomyces lactucae-debilis]ORY78589.1 hypothetical protein BCR37DRAFT_108432 [Protomyces lactucae-debilis]